MVRKLSATNRQILPKPIIDEADENNFISLEQLRQGITMRLPPFFASPGGRVNLQFSGFHRVWGSVVVEDPADDIVIPIAPADAIGFAAERRIGLQATYSDPDTPILISPVNPYRAGGEAYSPTIDEAVGGIIPGTEGFIPGDVRNATVRIEPFANMAAGDRIQLYILGSSPNGGARVTLEVEAADVGKDITFVLSTSTYRNGRLFIVYEVEQAGGRLIPPASIFRVEGQIGRVRPVYELMEEYLTPGFLPLTYDGEEGCVPIDVTIPGDADFSDQVTLYMVPRYGPAIVLRQAVNTPGREMRFCIPYERASKYLEDHVYMGCMLEYMAGGNTISGPVSSYALIAAR